MFTTTFKTLRRLSGFMPTVLLCASGMGAVAAAQSPILPVISSFPVAVPHNETYGAPWQTTVSNRGDFILFDFKFGSAYAYPVTGGAEVTIAAPGHPIGGFQDSGIAIDSRNNNLYTNDNYNNGLLEFPFDAATGTWDIAPVQVANNLQGNLGGGCGNYYQSAALSMNDNGIMAIATENGCGKEIFTVPIDASGNFGTVTSIVSNLSDRAKTVALDNMGNISFNEDNNGKHGVLFIPAGVTGLNGEGSVQIYLNDPKTYNVQGVAVDTSGNLYVADGNVGLLYVPLQAGSPDLAQAVLLSSIPASGGPAVDSQRGTVFMPIGSSVGSIKDVVKIYLNRSEFGGVTANATKAAAGGVTYYFAGVTKPYSFSLIQSGASAAFTIGDISKCGITSTTDKQGNPTVSGGSFVSGGTCTLPLTFLPATVGETSATLLMLDVKGDVLNTTTVHGTGQGAAVTLAPGSETALGSGLKTPSQVAVDAAGDVFVADSGLGKVLEFGTGATAPVSIGKGLMAPTGVAVDGSGDVFIADNGTLIEVPNTTTGLNTAGQSVIKAGLGTHTLLAADAIGDVFVADPDNQRVVRLRNNIVGMPLETDIPGFSQASAIASDGLGNLYVASGANLVVITPQGRVNAVTTLSGATGLAVDVSGAVYVTSLSGTVRIPSVGGTLNVANQTTIAAAATKPTSVALDLMGNAYVTDAATGKIDVVSVNGIAAFGSLATTTSSANNTVTLFDEGNLPLNVTAFTSSPDFSVTANTCIGAPIAVGSSCIATVTFNPGPGDQGLLKGQLTAASDAVNKPVAINTVGTGFALAASTTTLTVASSSVTNTSAMVTVAPASGTSPVPSGKVTLTVTAPGYGPVVLTQPLVNGAATFTETSISAGADTFTANYLGDRVYGTSTASSKTTVAPGVVTLLQPAVSTVPTYALAAGTGTAEPYDGSQTPFYYVYQMIVRAANGAPLVGLPIVDTTGKLTGYNYGSVTFGGAVGCAPVNVNADGTVMFQASCVNIDTSNNQIVNITTPYTITPTYNGPNYVSVTGTPFSYIAIRNPSVVITSNPAALTVAAGSSVTANLTLTSLLGYGVTGINSNLNNYSLPVALDCSGLPAHATCSFSYPTPDPSSANSTAVTPTTPGKVVLTINTNAAVGTTTAALLHAPAIFSATFGFGVLGIVFTRRRRLPAWFGKLACVLLLGGSAGALSSCSTSNINPNPQLTTPKGTYAVTITAKQTGSKVVTTLTGPVTVSGSGNQMSLLFTMNVVVQ